MPASFDLIASTLAYVALSFTPASVWQMSRGAVIITTAILSKLILKTKFTKSATLGCFLTLVGITLVQTFTIVIKDEESEALSEVGTSLEILGVCLLVASSIFNSLCLISEKWIF